MAQPIDFDFYCEVVLKPDANISIVFENDNILAFHHTKPAFERHIVIIPKKHTHDIRFIEDTSILVEIMITAKDIFNQWGEKYINDNGARLVTNLGVFQDTPHTHFHVIGGTKLKSKLVN
jgi:histidine triad (HIT) family protein